MHEVRLGSCGRCDCAEACSIGIPQALAELQFVTSTLVGAEAVLTVERNVATISPGSNLNG